MTLPEPWEAARVEAFLFRKDVTQVRSVDSSVWQETGVGADASSIRVAVAVLPRGEAPANPNSPDEMMRAQLESFPEPVLNARWHLLGYDVADVGRTSGLSNCGFVPDVEDVAALRARWGPSLNEWHLFTDLEEALSFAEMSDVRVAEHAPFHVFGLWEVRDPESD